ncbi:hypothetical protein EDD16DRAFT_119423 [Pisolithus croceorrhizus]|nr:hypothetical protein EDD16DRAFT_119423 [Pisolithus croceorrhizus]KAI6167790.1 hypothetical protein EDD17DRAFT_862835 [Pisolithus thermaeus]
MCPADCSPPGDGILRYYHGLVLLRERENVVNAVARGRFFFSFQPKHAFRIVQLCSILFIPQAITQLIWGLLMFIFSITISWVYNLRFLSYD